MNFLDEVDLQMKINKNWVERKIQMDLIGVSIQKQVTDMKAYFESLRIY